MVLNWRGAVMVLLACVGPAWSQTPMPLASASPGDRHLTVHENGKSLRCRLVTAWTMPDKSQAYQVQVIETGEMLTVVQDGTPQGEPAAKTNAQMMRIYHWGQSAVAPPGVPVPPSLPVPASVSATHSTVVPVSAKTTTPCDPCATSAPCCTPAPASTACKDRVIWWEEKNGKRVSPAIVTNGNNPFENQAAKPCVPAVVSQRGKECATTCVTVVQSAPSSNVYTLPAVRTTDQAAPPPPPTSTTTASTTAAAAEATKATPASQTKTTPLDKFFHPARETAVVRPPEPQPPHSFTSASPTPDTLPPAGTAKKDGRSTWGDNKVQAPGKSTVEQASVKPGTAPGAGPAGLKATDNAGDILLSPERIDAVGGNLTPRGINMNSFKGTPAQLMPKPVAPAPVQPTSVQVPGAPPTSLPPPPPPQVGPPLSSNGRIPLGAQSVVAAGANVPTQITYVPVPVATVPDPYRPPVPPPARVPAPPQPNAYVNAFTPSAPPQTQQPQDSMAVNAFSNMNMNPNPNMNMNLLAQRYPTQAPGYLPNPMTQGTPYPAFYGAPAPMQQANMLPPQGRPVMPYNAMQGQGYPPAMQQPVQQVNYAPAPGPAQQSLAAMQGQGYPPAMQQPVQQVNYASAPAPAQQLLANPAMDRRPGATAANATPELAQTFRTLRESPYPAQREWAATNLATFDWRANPHIVAALVESARHDPAATVRASCVYSLGRMNVASEPVLATLQTLRNDGDPRVRQEAEQALVRLYASRP